MRETSSLFQGKQGVPDSAESYRDLHSKTGASRATAKGDSLIEDDNPCSRFLCEEELLAVAVFSLGDAVPAARHTKGAPKSVAGIQALSGKHANKQRPQRKHKFTSFSGTLPGG